MWLGEPAAAILFELRMGALVEVAVRVNGISTALIVDIGSRYTGVNDTAAKAAGIEFERFPEQPSSMGLGQ